ncbi:SDR family NAD(P)-dependent oxidoreductase [Bacillus thuringiensis]|uniref:SDR family NAD(P)-dependent oxidoreductase n=1 Tax=Bacillus TaxID=1386 RepID=UPI000BEC3997|nr:SDR family NAD(P)-dependent oxidoreductase [Bacillus thuringiensis]MED2749910.1 SDR family NAD(P)-dependent oxidoreductase [Bacillus thuringiensis]MED2754990.1 SDR family NAD(P)-dependent oxidoreductase [Bacillus thuringiensis]MED2768972.1 SDR family NAD(P)-dependent oxidoreductase [Bacillus thuringiensis]MED2773181.1 SDR family NAD(P)-dependent oxidoreductase [Bacillus thuringiensis]MED2778320.1 SDR family NAD(P)-dependent oxidoreductase [Bacillus thuringiensis]
MNYKPLDNSKVYLVTGAAGFVGYFLCKELLEEGCQVIGVDNINDYYDVNLKYARLEQLKPYAKFTFIKGDISDKDMITQIFEENKPNIVVNLAAQAGVRYSIENPDVYIQSNIIGFYNILEACRHYPVDHLVYASSSSVYGANKKVPFEETDFVDNPVSLYASTKKSNELMAHTYSHLYKIPATGLRFFTVYGPMGRPDMAYFGFTDKYFAGDSIKIFNNGDFKNDLYRDFTYIDDIVEGIQRLLSNPPEGDVEHKVFNIGNNNPEKLMVFIETLEKALGQALGREVEFDKVFEPIKPGDVPATYASTDLLQKAVDFKPETSIQKGLQEFADWYVDYYKVT